VSLTLNGLLGGLEAQANVLEPPLTALARDLLLANLLESAPRQAALPLSGALQKLVLLIVYPACPKGSLRPAACLEPAKPLPLRCPLRPIPAQHQAASLEPNAAASGSPARHAELTLEGPLGLHTSTPCHVM
jgi:hypothetical protein